MAGARENQKIELLPGLYEGVGDLKGGGRVNIRVEFADGEKEISLKCGGVFNVGAGRVFRADGPTDPLLAPGSLVHAVIAAPGRGDGCFIKVAVEEQCAEGVLATGRMAVNTQAIDVSGYRRQCPPSGAAAFRNS